MDQMPAAGGGLTSLDAEFLDGMIAAHQALRNTATEYIRRSDETSNPAVVNIARDLLQQVTYTEQAYREMRGHADGDELRQQEHVDNVEVSAAY